MERMECTLVRPLAVPRLFVVGCGQRRVDSNHGETCKIKARLNSKITQTPIYAT